MGPTLGEVGHEGNIKPRGFYFKEKVGGRTFDGFSFMQQIFIEHLLYASIILSSWDTAMKSQARFVH